MVALLVITGISQIVKLAESVGVPPATTMRSRSSKNSSIATLHQQHQAPRRALDCQSSTRMPSEHKSYHRH
jgi:hypothetical protein